MRKGYVMEVKKEHLLVMTEDQSFVRLQKKPGVDAGEEILFAQSQVLDIRKTSSGREHFMKRVQQVKPIGIAAAMMLFVVVSMFAMGGNDEEAQYLLSFDVNPSMEIEIGEEEKVLEVHAVNEEAKELQLEALEGEKVEEFLDAYLEKMTEKGYMNRESAKVLLSYADLMEDEEASEELINQVTDQMQEYFAEKNLKVDINTLAATNFNIENAREQGISFGKLQLIEMIQNENNDEIEEVTLDSEEAQDPEESEEGEELKDKSVDELLDHPVFEVHPKNWDREDGKKPHPVFEIHPKNRDGEKGEKSHPVFDEHPGKRGNEDRNEELDENNEPQEDGVDALELEEEDGNEKGHPIFEDHPGDRDKENKEHPVFDEHPRDRNRAEDQDDNEDRDDNNDQQENEDDDEDEEWDKDKEHPIFDEHPGNRGNREEENSDSMRKGGN